MESSAAVAPHLSVNQVLDFIKSDDPDLRIRAAQEIRRLTKTSQRCRRQLSPAIPQLVSMLRVNSPESETALLALLNLAVKDEKFVTYSLILFFLFIHFFLILDFWREFELMKYPVFCLKLKEKKLIFVVLISDPFLGFSRVIELFPDVGFIFPLFLGYIFE